MQAESPNMTEDTSNSCEVVRETGGLSSSSEPFGFADLAKLRFARLL